MWQGNGEVPGLPLDQLRSLIRAPADAPMEGLVSQLDQSQVATTATVKPLSHSSLLRLWRQEMAKLGRANRRLAELVLEDLYRDSPPESPFLGLVSSVQQNDQTKAP